VDSEEVLGIHCGRSGRDEGRDAGCDTVGLAVDIGPVFSLEGG